MSMNQLPAKALEQHIIVLGKTGSGKSSVMRLLVERLLDQNKPVCIIDPKGDWHGLRSSADGKHAGYPVVIFGGEHADVPLNAHAGAQVAELVATGNRPCIIDLGGWSVGDRTRFFVDFASALFRTSRGPRWLVIDEVHNFCPQGKVHDPDAGKMLHWANRLASEGRGKGIQLLAASQRPQKVHKDFVTSCETLIAMRVIHPLDRNAVKEWIDGCPDREKGREVLETLASMPRGTGWVWSPEIGFGPERLAFPLFRTYDSFKAPTGEASGKLKGWAEVDLEEVKGKLASVVAEAQANDPKELRRQVVDLAKQLAAAQKTSKEVPKQEVQRVEVPIFKDEDYQRMEAVVQTLTKVAEDFRETVLSARRLALEARQRHAVTSPAPTQRQPSASLQPRPSRAAAPTVNGQQIKGGKFRALLVAMAQAGKPLTAEQLVARAGMSMSGTFDTYIGQFRQHGWIDGTRAGLQLTQAGRDALGDYEPLPTGEDLRRYWLSQVSGGKERSMLEAIFEAYPDTLDAQTVASRAQMSLSGTFDTYIGHLRRLLLVDGPRSALRANPELFE